MRNYATATIEGFVTHDPVLKTTKTGKALSTFSLAGIFFTGRSERRCRCIDV
jgi:single-stranded DNA-binding protein